MGLCGLINVGGPPSAGGGGTSGIQVISPGGNVGPTVTFQGANGIAVTSPGVNLILIDGAGASGVTGAASGITSINGDPGPAIDLIGNSGIVVTPLGGGEISIGLASSGVLKFAAPFTNVKNATFVHNIGDEDVIVQVYDDSSPRELIVPNTIQIIDANTVTIRFNGFQTGRIVVV